MTLKPVADSGSCVTYLEKTCIAAETPAGSAQATLWKRGTELGNAGRSSLKNLSYLFHRSRSLGNSADMDFKGMG